MTNHLSLAEAALYIGVPPGVLHQWAWDKPDLIANGRKWKPTFRKQELDQFMRDNHPSLSRSLLW
jgi:hypothetical protein